MNELKAKSIWNELLKQINNSSLEIETYVLTNTKTVFFKVSKIQDSIQISETGKNRSCKLTNPRIISQEEFVKTSFYFEQWEKNKLNVNILFMN